MKRLLNILLLFSLISTCATPALAAEEGALEFSLEQMVVTATKTEKSLKEVAASVSVITPEMIWDSSAKSLADLLPLLPGGSIETRGSLGGISGISIRGLNGGPGSQKILLLLDGRPANFAYSGDINWNSIPLENVERVEVIRGPASALYGANALGGVINVITKKPTKNTTTLKTQGGTNDTQIYSLLHMGKEDKLAYVVTLGSGKSDGHRPNGDYEDKDYTLKLDYAINPTTNLIFNSGYHQEDRGVAGSKTTPEKYYRDNIQNNYVDLEMQSRQENKTNKIRFYQNNSQSESTKSGSSTILSSSMKDSNIGLMLQQDINLSDRQTLTWGVEYQKQEATERLKNEKYDAEMVDLYLQNDQKISPRLNLNLGARLDHHSAFGNQVSPKLGLVYQAGVDTLVRVNVAKAFKAPSLADLYSTSSSGLGDPNLKPIELWNYELGLEKQFSPATVGKVVFFKSNGKNMIINERQSDGTRKKKNVGNIKPRGFEVELNSKLSSNLDVFANYTYLDVGDMTYLASRDRYNLGLRYKKGPFKANLTQQYIGSSYARDYHQMPIDGYSLTNLNLSYTPNSNLELALGVDNLFDKEYEVYKDYPMPGRVVTGSLSLKF